MNTITVSREEENILISIPASLNNIYVEQLLDYLKVKSIAAQSVATDEEIVAIANDINQSWWHSNKHNFIKMRV